MLTVSSRKSLACVEVVIEFERDDLIGRHTGLQQIVPEKDTEQVGFAAAPDTGDDFDLTVTAVGNQAVEASCSFNAHLAIRQKGPVREEAFNRAAKVYLKFLHLCAVFRDNKKCVSS